MSLIRVDVYVSQTCTAHICLKERSATIRVTNLCHVIVLHVSVEQMNVFENWYACNDPGGTDLWHVYVCNAYVPQFSGICSCLVQNVIGVTDL